MHCKSYTSSPLYFNTLSSTFWLWHGNVLFILTLHFDSCSSYHRIFLAILKTRTKARPSLISTSFNMCIGLHFGWRLEKDRLASLLRTILDVIQVWLDGKRVVWSLQLEAGYVGIPVNLLVAWWINADQLKTSCLKLEAECLNGSISSQRGGGWSQVIWLGKVQQEKHCSMAVHLPLIMHSMCHGMVVNSAPFPVRKRDG